MNIKKYSQGAAIPAYVTYTPVTSSYSRETGGYSGESSSRASSNDDSKGISDKDLLKALELLDGLPNEVREITSEILNFIMDQSMSMGSVDPARIGMRYAALVGRIKIAKFNAEEYKNAFNLIKGNGGINEIAIDSDGFIYCQNRHNPQDFDRFTPDEYLANYQDYKALSNQDLLNMRAQFPGLVDNNGILQVVSNGLGMSGIQQLINSAISKIGTTTMQQQGYSQTQQALIARGVEYIQLASQEAGHDVTDGMQVDGIYSLGVLSKDQLALAQLALNYILAALPKNAVSLLEIKAAEGGIPGGAKGLLNNLIQSKVDFTSTEKMSRSNNPKEKTSKSSPEAGPFDKFKLTPVMMAQLGYGERKPVSINAGNKYTATAYAQVVPIVKKSGDPLGANSTLLAVSESQLAGAINLEDATIGGARIDQAAMNKVAITSGNMYIMNVPIDRSRTDGVIAPDLKYLKRLEEADKEVEKWKTSHPNEEITAKIINDIYAKNNLPVLMDENGNINVQNYCKFAVFNGEVKDIYLIPPPDGSSIAAQDVSSKTNAQNYKDILSGNQRTKNQEEFDEDNFYDFNGHDTLLRGAVFVPLNTNILSGASTSGASITVAEATGIQELNEQKERLKYYDPNRASKFE